MPAGDDLTELEELLRTAGVATVGKVVQHREQPHPNTYLGPGKLEEVKEQIKRDDANLVACDDELSPRQERNLEEALGIPVIDRTAIILDIFAGHAHSAEGKLQVELAQLEYNLARMRGLWTHLERLGAAAVGTRGPGETQIETDRRLARDRIAALRRRLARVKSSRDVMRAERERAQLPTVALAGYTNAGKSTLLNALTGAEVGVRDRLFHTLDPTTRVMAARRPRLPADRHRRLHPQAAPPARRRVRRDAEETRLADLLLHVVDASAAEDEHGRDAAGGRRRAGRDRRRRPTRACSCSTRPTHSIRPAATTSVSATPTGCSSRRSAARGSRRWGSGSRRSSRGRCATSSCCCRIARAAGWPSCTSSPATCSARTRPRACGCGRACRRRWRRASSATRSDGRPA